MDMQSGPVIRFKDISKMGFSCDQWAKVGEGNLPSKSKGLDLGWEIPGPKIMIWPTSDLLKFWWKDDLHPDESDTLLGNQTYPLPFGACEDDFPFAKVENGSFLEGNI